jgi:LytS/YehU family sensor histidine kinase
MPVIGAISVITYLLSTALHYAFEAFERSRTAELLSREAQLKALKAQVNPHFLFNSLNSISALTSIDDKRAREMCLRLSDFLRSSLTLGERVSIPFAEELALARTYLGVEQVRFGERLQFTQDVDEHCALCEVPPLMIQPLVENAIKHGVATLVEGGLVSIRAHCQADTLRVVVENSFDPEAPPADKSGFGIANVRRRLQTRYGSAATLDIAVEQNTYRVTIAAPCRRDRT